jgi:hypothetical protein
MLWLVLTSLCNTDIPPFNNARVLPSGNGSKGLAGRVLGPHLHHLCCNANSLRQINEKIE